MDRHEENGVHWLTFKNLSSFPLKHGTFLRHGGYSSSHLSSLNFGKVKGETEENLLKNISKALKKLETAQAYSGKQCHGKKVCEVTKAFLEKKEEVEADSLMTNEIGVGLMIKHADCQAAIIYDPIHHAVAAVHCGWRGSAQNIYLETLNAMKARYGTKSEDVFVGISPSLGPTKAEFIHYKIELPEPFWDFQIQPTYFDFWEISKMQLMSAGVPFHHIEIAGICTYENEKDFFSHRRNPASGRNATLVALSSF